MATRHIQAEVQGRVLADQIEAPQDEVITERLKLFREATGTA
jgi:hypothetical protein